MIKHDLWFTLIAVSAVSGAVIADSIYISAFETDRLKDWKHKKFKGKTQYEIVTIKGKTILRAQSLSSASGLFKERRIDLRKTPYLNWSWRIENRLGKLDEQNKTGDDYAARVYVVIDGGWTFWNTRAINYVWSGNSIKGKIWPNAFAGENAMMMALRTSEDPVETWFTEKRNVLEDLKRVYGENIPFIDAVALMTDTDNAEGNVTAFYGDIYFSSD